MKIKKIFILFTMLVAGLSFSGANNNNNMIVADAASGSAVLSSDWKSKIGWDKSQVKTLLITNKAVKRGYLGSPADVTDSNNSLLEAYFYVNQIDSTKLDCVLYGDVQTIYAQDGESLFSGFPFLESITFECNFSMEKSTDKSMKSMFAENTNLKEVNGLNYIDTFYATNMSYMFSNCYNLKSINGLNDGENAWHTFMTSDMSSMFSNCMNLTSLDLSGFDFSSISSDDKLEDILLNANSLTEIKIPNNLNKRNFKLPSGFYTDKVDPSMHGLTLLKGSKELNDLASTLKYLDTCTEYMQAPALQATYDSLNDADKITFSTLKDYNGVLLTEKLTYMVHLAEAQTMSIAESYKAISPITSQYLVVIIACLSLTLIGGYYFVQKKKYAK